MVSGALGEGCACGWELPFLLILGPSCAEVFLSYLYADAKWHKEL